MIEKQAIIGVFMSYDKGFDVVGVCMCDARRLSK